MVQGWGDLSGHHSGENNNPISSNWALAICLSGKSRSAATKVQESLSDETFVNTNG